MKGTLQQPQEEGEVTADVVMPVGPVGEMFGVQRGVAKEASKGDGWGWGGTTGRDSKAEYAKKLAMAAFGESEVHHPARAAPSFIVPEEKKKKKKIVDSDDSSGGSEDSDARNMMWEDRVERRDSDHDLGVRKPRMYGAKDTKELKKFHREMQARNGNLNVTEQGMHVDVTDRSDMANTRKIQDWEAAERKIRDFLKRDYGGGRAAFEVAALPHPLRQPSHAPRAACTRPDILFFDVFIPFWDVFTHALLVARKCCASGLFKLLTFDFSGHLSMWPHTG